MALVLVRLKLAIQRRTFGRSGTTQRILYIGGWLIALALGLAVGATFEALARREIGGELAFVGVTTALFAGWVMLPLTVPVGQDQTVDPTFLEQYPLTAEQQVAGLLAAGLVSPTALFTLLAVAGGTFAPGEPIGGRLAVLFAAALFTVLCVAASRTLLAIVAQAIRSRRGRDLVIAGTGVLMVVIYLMTQTAHDLTERYAELENGPLESVLAWLPPGSIGAALMAVRDNEWLMATAHLAVPTLTIGALSAAWAWAIRRRVRVAGHPAHTRSARTRRIDIALIPLPYEALGSTPTSAAAGQQARYYFFRSAKAAQGFLLPVIIAAIAAHASIADNGLVLSATIFTGIALLSSVFNVFGYDDTGLAFLATCAPPWRSVLAGKILAPAPVIALATGLFVVIESLIVSGWSDSAAAFSTALGMLFAGLGVGAFTSVRFMSNLVVPGGSRERTLIGLGAGLGLLVVVALLGGALWVAASGAIGEVGAGLVVCLLGAIAGYGCFRFAARSLSDDPRRLIEATHV